MLRTKVKPFESHCDRIENIIKGTVEYQVNGSGVKVFREFRCNHESRCGVRVVQGPHSWTYDWDKCPAFRTLRDQKAQ